MLRLLYISLLLLIIQSSLFALEIDNTITFNEVLLNTYEDSKRDETIKSIIEKEFISSDKKIIGFGYSPTKDIWVKFRLINSSPNIVEKVIEYANPLTSSVVFFENGIFKKKDGLLNFSKNNITINPILKIKLKPYESKLFYIKASSKITTLIIKINIWSPKVFEKKEYKKQTILSIFFGAMLIMIFYNLTVFIGTRELSYIYYTLFIFSGTIHHLLYTGYATIYLDKELISTLIPYSSVIVALPTIFLALFTQYILQLKQYPKLYMIFIYLLIIYPIAIISIEVLGIYQYRSLFFIIFVFFLFFVVSYALFQKNKKVRFIIVGWIFYIISGLFMYLSSSGFYDNFTSYPYIVELSLVVDIIIFAFALSYEIKILNEEKLISQERAIFLRELKHRIQNNMSIIIYFLQLQQDNIEDNKLKEILINLENRVRSISDIYMLLDIKTNMLHIDKNRYFRLLTNNIKNSFNQNSIKIEVYNDMDISSQDMMYCGIIINEALTNSFKYAFQNIDNPTINISLNKKLDKYHLSIKDNGNGFKKEYHNGLGLDIIKILATMQLKGTLNIDTTKGVEIDILWRKDEK